jgi:protein TonB
MNIHKYVIPATIAATIHFALLTVAPESAPILMEVPLAKPDLPPFPPKPIEMRPEEEPATASEPAKSLLGEPPPISLDEPPPGRIDTTMFPVPVEPARPDINVNRHTLPAVIGDPHGGLNGEFRPPSSIIHSGLLDNVPRAKVQIAPEYPYAMSRTGISGTVFVEFDVDATGKVIRAEAVRSTNHEFAEPAVRAVRQWRFEPGRRNGKAVPFRMTVPIEFGLEGS